MGSVNLRANIKKIDECVQKFHDEISELNNEIEAKKKEILRLEGSKIVYEGLTDVFGDSINHSGSREMDKPKTDSNEKNVHEHNHDECEHNRDECKESEEITLDELYKKYRAM
jgi:hypothetical protein